MSYCMDTGRKQINAHKLAMLLSSLPEDHLVEVNAVGNLRIEQNGEMVGFVNMGSEEIEMSGDETDNEIV